MARFATCAVPSGDCMIFIRSIETFKSESDRWVSDLNLKRHCSFVNPLPFQSAGLGFIKTFFIRMKKGKQKVIKS